jgi:hypothetical protein
MINIGYHHMAPLMEVWLVANGNWNLGVRFNKIRITYTISQGGNASLWMFDTNGAHSATTTITSSIEKTVTFSQYHLRELDIWDDVNYATSLLTVTKIEILTLANIVNVPDIQVGSPDLFLQFNNLASFTNDTTYWVGSRAQSDITDVRFMAGRNQLLGNGSEYYVAPTKFYDFLFEIYRRAEDRSLCLPVGITNWVQFKAWCLTNLIGIEVRQIIELWLTYWYCTPVIVHTTDWTIDKEAWFAGNDGYMDGAVKWARAIPTYPTNWIQLVSTTSIGAANATQFTDMLLSYGQNNDYSGGLNSNVPTGRTFLGGTPDAPAPAYLIGSFYSQSYGDGDRSTAAKMQYLGNNVMAFITATGTTSYWQRNYTCTPLVDTSTVTPASDGTGAYGYVNLKTSVYPAELTNVNYYTNPLYPFNVNCYTYNPTSHATMVYNAAASAIYNQYEISPSYWNDATYQEKRGMNQIGSILLHEMAHCLDYFGEEQPGATLGTAYSFEDPWATILGIVPYMSEWHPTKTTHLWTDGTIEYPITPYGAGNHAESFAEAIMYYNINPTALMELCPRQYATLTDLFATIHVLD